MKELERDLSLVIDALFTGQLFLGNRLEIALIIFNQFTWDVDIV